ncbi:MAG: class I SAM-dependent methyltransferase [Planctomycetota bacterium]
MQKSQTIRPVTPTAILAQGLAELLANAKQATLEPIQIERFERLANIASGLDPYIAQCTTEESEDLRMLVERTQQNQWSDKFGEGETVVELESEMLSGHVEGQFLKFLIHISKATRILEIGMFTGYATLAMAESIPENGKIVACELDPYTADFARESFVRAGVSDKIDIRIGSAHESLIQLSKEGLKFDLIFIDAEKPGYSRYFDAILDADLLSDHGFMVVDNTLLQGEPYLNSRSENGEAIRGFNEHVSKDARVEQVLIPLRDGLSLIRRVGVGENQ